MRYVALFVVAALITPLEYAFGVLDVVRRHLRPEPANVTPLRRRKRRRAA